MRKIEEYISKNGLDAFKQLCYRHASIFKHVCILDSCSLNTGVAPGKYEFLAAYGSENIAQTFEELEILTESNSWIFGVLGYDLKNKFETLESTNTPFIETPETFFFTPKILLAIDKFGTVTMLKGRLDLPFFNEEKLDHSNRVISNELNQNDKEEYLAKIHAIHKLIQEGEVYELNYCLNFKHQYKQFDPIKFQIDLLKSSPVPMGSYLKVDTIEMCGASMERFLAKHGRKLISQPIKGTIRKGKDIHEDNQLIAQLYESEKDRAENVMIVDLVRNDLARICESGSVEVDELFGIYSYLQVHQMISTVSGILKKQVYFGEIIRALFPMGSMTGAPKIAAMKHIDNLEDFKRNWYSGAVGYIDPQGDFDFNVVIRSLFCDTKNNSISYCAGGAITIDSEPEKELEEVILKTKAIKDLLAN